MRALSRHRGFTLIELMISLTLGLLISGAIVRVMVSNNEVESLNRALTSAQENGRFIVSRMRSEVLMAGRYDSLSPRLNTDVDIVAEAAFITKHPIPLPGDFTGGSNLGAKDGVGGADDTLVISYQGDTDCRGYKLGYASNEEFYVVNEFFVEQQQLKCRGFDGRVLRGQKAATANDNNKAYTLLDDVYSFQVQYGIANHLIAGDNSARPVRYVSADLLAAQLAGGGQVTAVRIAVLVKGDSDVTIEPTPQFKLLNEAPFSPSEKRFFKQFETTISLRNVKNFMRTTNI